MTDLGTLPGDVGQSDAENDKGQIVGESCPASGSCRGFIWQNGAMTDLNLLVPPKSLTSSLPTTSTIAGKIAALASSATKPERAVVLIPGKKSNVIPGSAARPVALPETCGYNSGSSRASLAHSRACKLPVKCGPAPAGPLLSKGILGF